MSETVDVRPRSPHSSTASVSELSNNPPTPFRSASQELEDQTENDEVVEQPQQQPQQPLSPAALAPFLAYWAEPRRASPQDLEVADLNDTNLNKILLSRYQMRYHFIKAETVLLDAFARITCSAGVAIVNLPPRQEPTDIISFFSRFGKIVECHLATKKEGREGPKTSAFILFEDVKAAKSAVKKVNTVAMSPDSLPATVVRMSVSHVRASRSVWVGNLRANVTLADLEAVFKQCGSLVQIRITPAHGGSETSTAVIEYKLMQHALNALKLHMSGEHTDITGSGEEKRLFVSFTYRADNRVNEPQLSATHNGGPLRFGYDDKLVELRSSMENCLVRVYRQVDMRDRHSLHFVTGTSFGKLPGIDGGKQVMLHVEGLNKPVPAGYISNECNVALIPYEVYQLEKRLMQHPEQMLSVEEMAGVVCNVESVELWSTLPRSSYGKSLKKSDPEKYSNYGPMNLLRRLFHGDNTPVAPSNFVSGSGKFISRKGPPFAPAASGSKAVAFPAAESNGEVSSSLRTPLQQQRGTADGTLLQTLGSAEGECRKSDSPRPFHLCRYSMDDDDDTDDVPEFTEDQMEEVARQSAERVRAKIAEANRLRSLGPSRAAPRPISLTSRPNDSPANESPDKVPQASRDATVGSDASGGSPGYRNYLARKAQAEVWAKSKADIEAAKKKMYKPQRRDFTSDEDYQAAIHLMACTSTY
jgi:hypothetical protein